MTDLSAVLRPMHPIATLVETCRQRGLFDLLDAREFRGRAQLIDALQANAGALTIALDALVSHGWLETDDRDAYRLTGEAPAQPAADSVAPDPAYAPLLQALPELLFGDGSAVLINDEEMLRAALGVAAAGAASVRDQVAVLLEADAVPVNDALAVIAKEQSAHYVDRRGRVCDALTIVSAWQQQLRALAAKAGASPVVIAESHGGDVEWLHRLAAEPTISADAFLILAASAGLFNDDIAVRSPHSSQRSRFSLHRLTRRDYVVRHAAGKDLERLCELESLCWQHTRTPKEQIHARLQTYPQGQFVLEKDGEVLGVIYSQRIASVDALMACRADDVHRLHDPSGSIIQLLAVNVDPRTQNAGYGDQLLELMLQRCGLMTGVEQVVGVTLCKSYDAASGLAFDQYIRQQGRAQDPVLAFHHAHGAEVVKTVPGYRPQDRANLQNGVLVAYDILNRRPRRQSATAAVVGARVDRASIEHFVRSQAAQLLGISEQEIDIDRPVMEMGLESADLLKLQRLCEERFGIELRSGFFFEHSNIARVVDFLAAKLVPPPDKARPARRAAHGVRDDRDDSHRFAATDIAIVGMSCKLPGGIDAPEQLWRVLASGQCVISPFPRARGTWPDAAEFPGIDQGGFVTDVDAFDTAFFRISPAEAQMMDPQQRMLLELAWGSLEDAGVLPAALKGSNTGVFVGASNSDYSRLAQETGVEIEAHNGVGSSLAILANRISYFFDLSGPSLVVETACSSSLVALHSAVQSLRSAECAAALVAGVNLICHPDLSVAYHKAGMLAPDGRCKVFDARADGYVRSEGAAVLLLKPLAAAMAEGNRIHAVIRGSASNHGGLAGGLTVPNPQKQKELLLAAWKDAGVTAHDLTYIEAHGTGTALGDPIEIEGIQTAYAALGGNEPSARCSIGSVKSNLGHLESAAGITGLLKVVLSFQHRQLPPSVNLAQLNPKIRFSAPFSIQDRLGAWDPVLPRVAAVSSFGSGGANAHVVLQEYPEPVADDSTDEPHLFVLSAANENRLRVYAGRAAEWLEQATAASFASAIFTWQTGRTAMKHRLVIKTAGRADLLDKLNQWLAGNPQVADLWSGQAGQKDSSLTRVWQTKAGRQVIDQALAGKDLDALGPLWASGADIDWRKLYEAGDEPTPVGVPTYPFARDRFWIDAAAVKPLVGKTAPDAAGAAIHPLLHTNTSILNQQSYSSVFSGEEFFLADHRVRFDERGVQKVLPGVAYLEMARAAVDHALPARPDASVVELRNTVWVQPIVADGRTQVRIALSADENNEIDYEIYSQDADEAIVHCQGRAVLTRLAAPVKLDVAQLSGQMNAGSIDANGVYAACTRMGLVYGPAFRGITVIHRGNDQLLAVLRLPKVAHSAAEQFVLHPSVMDGAVQASLGLFDGWAGQSNQPQLPFALESLRVLAPCTAEMLAWVRYAPGSGPDDKIVKLDIDLCDEQGNVCVQLHGFYSRIPNRKAAAGSLFAAPQWRTSESEAPASAVEWAQHHVILCELPEIDAEGLSAALPGSECLPLGGDCRRGIDQRYADHAAASFERIQSILQSKPQGKVLVQIVVADHGEQVLFAGLSGLLRSAALENPQLNGQVILVSRGTTTEELRRTLQNEARRAHDAQVRYVSGVRQTLSWELIPAQPDSAPVAFKDHGVYLITGGMGGLGVLFAREILERTRGAKVVMTGRSALDAAKQAVLDELSGMGGRVSYREVDVRDLPQVEMLVAAIQDDFGPLDGILHGAGVIADNFILKKTGAQLREVLGPKVAGAFNLDVATKDVELDFFVLFSSIAGALGNVGQADYAAANGFLDQFAAYRNRQVAARQRHGRTRSIDWPLWQDGGMGNDAAGQTLRQRFIGMEAMQTATGLRAFHRSLALPGDQMLVMEGDVAQLRRLVQDGVAAPRLEVKPSAASGEADHETLAEKTQQYLRKQLAGLLKMPAQKLDPNAALEEYGIDSMLAMKLTNQLEKTFGSLSKTLFFEYQTIRDLTRYFLDRHSAQLGVLFAVPSQAAEAVPVTALAPALAPALVQAPRASIAGRRTRRPMSAASPDPDPIAIVGLSGRYPGAVDIDAFWRNLRDGADCIIEVPRERWDWRAHYSEDRNSNGRHYSKWGGFIAGVDEFDPLFFNISPRDATYIDPQERLFLQHAWMAVEDAGYTRATLQVPHEQDLPGQVGVYVGVMWSEYQLFGAEANLQDLRMGFAGNMASIANRVSYILNLHGPSMTLDTMCSSSLTAIHVACQDLKAGRTRLAIAGGVNISIHPNKYLMLSTGQFISSDGHCQSFGEGGDGYIPGEGVGVVVLKRLSEAERDGDHIYGVIRGSALTHGGKTNGYTVPNPQAQASAISRALTESKIDARHISYVEAHGTGTKLGDPIEIAALGKVFDQYTKEKGICLIGSAKSNIGHCESAAGIAGLTKVLLQMQHRQIVPSLHSAQLNPHIDFDQSPFVVNQSLRDWEAPVVDGRTLPRIAGISSFGAGGSNAHMIVEEYRAPVRQPMSMEQVVIVLSARTIEQLRQKAADLLDFVRERGESLDLVATAYTLQVGREAMDERLALVVGSAAQLAEKLAAYVAGDETIDDLYLGQVKRNEDTLSLFSTDLDLQQTVEKWIAGRKFSKLLDLWVKGLELDWAKLYGEIKPARISLPTYPFAKEHYWIETAGHHAATPTTAVLHPLLHRNTSDLSEERFRSTFTGAEFFLADHQLAPNGQLALKVLPGVAYLEMARAAIEQALPERPESRILELRNLVWAQPIVVAGATDVFIALSVNDDDQIDYEIYSHGAERENIHCQGNAVLSRQPAPPKLDLEQLEAQMTGGAVETDRLYAACARMGLLYGPAFRGVDSVRRGSGQLLARLRLPSAVAGTAADYLLHPSLMDAALQTSMALGELAEEAGRPSVPFALEVLRIIAPCAAEMTAWVRYVTGSQVGDKLVKLDIDLCDERGNVCVQMLGLSLRVLSGEIAAAATEHATGSLLATPAWEASSIAANAERAFAQHHVILCELPQIDLRALESSLPHGACHSLTGRGASIAQRYDAHALACFERVRSILEGRPQEKVLLQVVIAAGEEHAVLAGVSGLLKTAALENLQFAGQVIIVAGNVTADELASLLRDEKRGALDAVVRHDHGVRQVLRWLEMPAGADNAPAAFKDDGVYLITGGMGGLGLLFAEEIVEQTRHARVILTGRSALSPEKEALLSSDRITYRQVDLVDPEQVERLIAGVRDEYRQLNGILHCAGMISDHLILKKSGDEFAAVLAPKVAGTFNLDQASRDLELDFFVLFSSTSAALGNLGQADYATANGFMDQFAAYRNRQVAAKERRGRTRSINWPLWQSGGMGIDAAGLELLRQTTGMQPMQTATGVQAFHRSVALPYDQLLVIEGDLTRIRRVLASGRPVQQEPAARPASSQADAASIDSGDLLEKTQEYLQRQFSDLLKLPAQKIDPLASLEQYGIDSVLAMQLINRLEKTFGSLTKTLIFEYQTVRELSGYFIAHYAAQLTALFAPAAKSDVAPAGAPAVVVESKPISSRRFSRVRGAVAAETAETESIAIVGLSGRYPGALDVDTYWQNLREGKDSIVEVPKDRWEWQAYFSEDRNLSGRHYSKWGGFIDRVDEFDPQFFNIAPKEAKYIDPQERLFLQHAWMAVEDAGYTRAALQVPHEKDLPGQVGVYVGVMWSEYQLFGAQSKADELRMGFAGNVASIANRVSYVLNVHGPSVTLDTMCSSSLTAIHFACQDLKLGRTSLALAGGVNVSVHPHKYLMLSIGQFISSDGHCQSFGEGGDGYIPGEGVGVVVLKRLSEAKRDGDHIYGVIRGSALTHGGKTSGYTVPNPQAQASAVSRALAESRTDARHVSYIEAHGTGTKLGDPIEIAALGKAFNQYTQEKGFCLIGSAKSNIGHCESAAGIAGLTKVLLQMRHQTIVPSLHSAQLNPHIDFDESPFVVNQTLRPWEAPVVDGRTLPRIAGISSFGAGGSNAHMIVEEFRAPVRQPMSMEQVVIVLSARTLEQLRQKAADLLNLVRARGESLDLVATAYTLQVGREPMDERVGFVVSSAAQLAGRLAAYVAGDEAIEDCYSGQVRRNKEALAVFTTDTDLQQAVEKWIANRKLSKLLDMWVKGLELDWSKLYGETRPARVSLPAYPFARERHWIETPAQAEPQTALTAVLHPLLHSNTSDLTQQSYSSTFTGEELFLREGALPAAACLEMARAAMEKASRNSSLELRNVLFAEPAALNQTVHIALLANGGDEVTFEIYSQTAENETIHCQGRATTTHEPAPAALDLGHLKAQMRGGAIEPASVYAASDSASLRAIASIDRGESELLAHLRIPHSAEAAAAGFVLHPSLLHGALAAAAALNDGAAALPVALESLRVVAPCTTEMVAWVRQTSNGVDIDLCDGQGNVAAQLRGVTWQAMESVAVERIDEVELLPAVVMPAHAALEKKELTFLTAVQAPLSAPAARGKRAAIALAAPGANGPAALTGRKAAVMLASTAPVVAANAAAAVSPVKLYDCGNGIFFIEIAASRSDALIAHAVQALDHAESDPAVKALMLSGIEHCFPRGGRDESNEAVERSLFRRLASFPYPVIAVQPGDVIGAGFLAAALCDFMVCHEDARYGFTDAAESFVPTPAEASLFSERFGELRASDFLFGAGPFTGKQLRARGWTCPILPWPEVEAHAEQLAVGLAAKSRDALRLLKQHLTRNLRPLVDELAPVAAADDLASPSDRVLTIKLDSIAELAQAGDCKAVVLVIESAELEADMAEIEQLLAGCEIPVVAALTAGAKGNAWLAAQFCDAVVYSKQGRYSAAGISAGAAMLFAYRLGSESNEIVLTGADYSGAELQQRITALTVVDSEKVLPAASDLAASWARLPHAALAAWKKRSASALQACSLAVAGEPVGETLSPRVTAPISIPLQSRAVTATAYPDGIVVVRMEERQAKNMFSDALVAGVTEAFAHVGQSTAYKVVILTGYDSYFASGGTKETLLAIQQGTVKFTDVKVFQAALDCRLPVIAAMQGHGIGAGWSMGMFADLALLSEESRYVSPYMGYGFTPGAGATYIFGEKIGQDLARESLLTAQQYTGRELAARGMALRALPRADVETTALTLAGQIARAPRGHLVALKDQLAARIRNAVEETYRLELAMHEQTFVGRSDTLAQIESEFQSEAHIAPQQPVAPTSSHPGGDALRTINAALRALLADELQLPEQDIDEKAQFVDLGLDSISGVSWIRKINEMYQTSIEATKVYSYPTLAQLSRYVRDEAAGQGTLPAEAAPAPAAAPAVPTTIVAKASAPRPTAAARPAGKALISLRSGSSPRFATAAVDQTARAPQAIAVIGMAGRFPRARNLDEFWENIAGGRNCITEVPPIRWDVGAYYQPGDPAAGKTISRWAGTIEEHDRFDPLFFSISPTEAENMEPQQRLFLEACWHSIENAGYAASALSGSRCGVFVGCADGNYHQLSRQHQLSAQGFTGSAMSILAARISYFLNLQGPCISIDTACSSSLVALAQACDSLASGASDLALAGGVYVMVGPEMHIKTSQAGMLSADGRCFAFDQRANGFVPGEGVGVVLLKRLADAERDGDIVHAVIQGWGVNQDGKTNGITAPSPDSQTRLEQEVYDKYRIDPAGIQLVEAHGTGTKLGDPIEVEGLKNAFKKYTQDEAYCAIGSVKSNIGHCLTAAGIAGVLKLVLALKHRQLPPSINFESLNEHIDLAGSPFYVNDRLRDWTSAGARRAATSSFGFSGTNAHVVIGEHLPAVAAKKRPVTVITQDAKTIIPLSARTPEQLEQKAREMLELLRRDASIDLMELAYTLQVGREAMDERLGVLAASTVQLAETLQAFVDGKTRVADLQRGRVNRGGDRMSIMSQDEDVRETIVAKWIGGRKLSQLLELWVNGLDLDWHRLYGEVKPRRIELPVYPFARERYWIDSPAPASVVPTAVLHPLLHSNTSDLTEHRYSSTFTGDEFFLADHRVRTNGRNVQKLLPGVAYLEMARAAVSQAIPARGEPAVIELHHTVWLKPVVVTEPAQVSIALIAADDDRVDYEVYSVAGDDEQQIVHCRGQAVLSRRAAPARLDLPQLARRMNEGRLDAAEVYTIFARMGLHYGPAHQGITAIELGNGELLAHLRLPAAVEPAQHAFVLHPSLMDSALQASVGLIVDLDDLPARPSVPFAVESLRIAAPCSREMAAWVRYTNGSKRGDLAVKVDIDLCDLQGHVCVEIRGFASRALESEAKPVLHGSSGPMLHAKGQPAGENLSFDDAFYQSLIADIADGSLSVEEAVDLE